MDIDIERTIKSLVDKNILFEQRLPFIPKLLPIEMKLYKTTTHHKNKILSLFKDFDLHHIKENSILILGSVKLFYIVFDWLGLLDLKDSINNINFVTNNEKIKNNLDIIDYEIKRCISMLNASTRNVIKNFSNCSIQNSGITMYEKIVPEMVVNYNNICKKITSKPINEINKIEFFTDPSGNITNVQIDNKHPNADENGWYCLGDLKFSHLETESINKILDSIKIYNFKDSYWKREEMDIFWEKQKTDPINSRIKEDCT